MTPPEVRDADSDALPAPLPPPPELPVRCRLDELDDVPTQRLVLGAKELAALSSAEAQTLVRQVLGAVSPPVQPVSAEAETLPLGYRPVPVPAEGPQPLAAPPAEEVSTITRVDVLFGARYLVRAARATRWRALGVATACGLIAFVLASPVRPRVWRGPEASGPEVVGLASVSR